MTPEETEKTLAEETEKWLRKGEDAYAKAKPCDGKGQEFLTNVGAYLTDAKHFRAQGDLVRAFEAVVWAWAWLEIGKDQKTITF